VSPEINNGENQSKSIRELLYINGYSDGESVALLVAHRPNNRKVVGSMPANVVCITVLTGNRLG